MYDFIFGNNEVKSLLSVLSSKLDDIPRIIVIRGDSGTGKTLYAKAFSDSIHYRFVELNGYGNIESIFLANDTNDNILYDIKNFDKLDYQAQYSIFSMLSIYKKNVFYVLEISSLNVLKQIRDMSIEIILNKLSENDLRQLAVFSKVNIENDILDKIIRKSCGDARQFIRLVDLYKLYGKDIFENLMLDSKDYLIKFLLSCFIQDKEKTEKLLDEMQKYPLSVLKEDYEQMILDIMKIKLKVIEPFDEVYSAVNVSIKGNMMDVFKVLNDKVIYDMFDSNKSFLSAMWYIYMQIGKIVRGESI